MVVFLGNGSSSEAHALLEDLLQELLGVRYDYRKLSRNFRGKPFIENHPVHFNLSHTKEKYVLGLCLDTDFGIDLETGIPGDDMNALAEYAFSPDERQILIEDFSEATFLKIWTMKEAYLKATGVGLIDSLPSLSVVSGPDLGILDSTFSSYQYVGKEAETISLVCKGNIPDIVILEKTSRGMVPIS